ncbi:MAG: hypothetical protein KDK70_05735 [Myxococcales bacterium]|nr:hypothetical protein [Myxococcales bacterium]
MIPYHEILSRLPIESIEPLDELCVRFCYPRVREVPLHWAMLLDARPDLSRIEPETTDRRAVADRVAGLRHALYESFEQGRGSALFETMGITDPSQWRDVLVDHYCRPQWIYTNGQQAYALVERRGPRYEVSRLPSLDSLHEFRTLDIRRFIDPREVLEFGHQDGAETYVLEGLSQVKVRVLPLRGGLRRRLLLLQECGTRPGGPGRPAIALMLAHVGGRSHLLQIQPDRRDAYTVLNELPELLDDDVVEACATCAGFRFSGKAREASGGTRGFCRRRLDAARASGLPMPRLDVKPRFGTSVSVFDRCRAYVPIDDEDREVPFCQAGDGEG